MIVGNQSYPCFYADQVIHMEQLIDQWLYNGSLICPPCDKVCSPSKCASYDKKLIDQIADLSLQNETNYSNHTLEMLRSILDEYYNGVDTRGGTNLKKSFVKYKSVLEEMSKLADNQKQEDNTISYQHLLSSSMKGRLETRPSLVCSSANSHTTHNFPLTFKIIHVVTSLAFAILMSRSR